ncbi:MAG: sigma-70 family RNA polymerase sigma factor [Burkholderiales bacterium]|nr:sigma-70 family RNA polymerase sigma factor [Burkholderiales bacterium]
MVKQYRCRLTRTLSRMIKNHAELEDVVQETFLKAYRSIDCFRGESSFFTWLCRIGINTAKNHLKMASRYRLAIDTDEGVSTQSLLLRDEATPEALLIGKQLKETLEQAINHLPDDLKRALWLREIEGLHYDEIAEAMNCYVGTVRSRLFRARKTIVEKIGRGIRN